MPSLKRAFYLALAKVAELPEAERRAIMARAWEILREEQGETLLQEALGPGWRWPGDLVAGGDGRRPGAGGAPIG